MSLEVWQAILNFRYISVVWMVLAVIGVVIVYFRLTSQLRRFANARAYKPEKANQFFFTWRYVFMFSMGRASHLSIFRCLWDHLDCPWLL